MTADVSEGLGPRLVEARKLAGLSQEKAAAKIDVTTRTLQRWESGDTGGALRHLPRVAEVYGTTRDALLGSLAGDHLDPERVAALEGQVAALTEAVESLTGLLGDPDELLRRAEQLRAEAPAPAKRKGPSSPRGGRGRPKRT